MRKTAVLDCTLKELCTNSESRLLFREKLAIAVGICRYGADAVELPPVKNLREDKIIFKTIAESVKDAALALPICSLEEGFAAISYDCIKTATHPRLQISLPVSTVQMEYRYGLKASAMLEKIKALICEAKSFCADVEFEALDASRADGSFLAQACLAAVQSGACEITVSDDAGIMMPEDFASLVTSLKKEIKVPLYVKTSDEISLAAANALCALKAGADGVKVSAAGKLCLKTDSFAGTLKAKGFELGLESGLKYSELNSDIEGMLHGMKNRNSENFAAQTNGSAVFLDAESTLTQVSDAVKTLGYDISSEDLGRVYEALHRLCETKSSIEGKELDALVASVAMQCPATYTLVSYIGTTSNKVKSVTNVVLERDGELLSGTGTGGGPIDSAFTAIEQCIGCHYELDDFQVQAVTEGRESLGSALVRLRSGGKLYSGNGLSSDICGASIRAYINAINKIAYEESQK